MLLQLPCMLLVALLHFQSMIRSLSPAIVRSPFRSTRSSAWLRMLPLHALAIPLLCRTLLTCASPLSPLPLFMLSPSFSGLLLSHLTTLPHPLPGPSWRRPCTLGPLLRPAPRPALLIYLCPLPSLAPHPPPLPTPHPAILRLHPCAQPRPMIVRKIMVRAACPPSARRGMAAHLASMRARVPASRIRERDSLSNPDLPLSPSVALATPSPALTTWSRSSSRSRSRSATPTFKQLRPSQRAGV
jgi:hypothetical protein